MYFTLIDCTVRLYAQFMYIFTAGRGIKVKVNIKGEEFVEVRQQHRNRIKYEFLS